MPVSPMLSPAMVFARVRRLSRGPSVGALAAVWSAPINQDCACEQPRPRSTNDRPPRIGFAANVLLWEPGSTMVAYLSNDWFTTLISSSP